MMVLRDAAPTGLNPDEIVLAIAQTGKKFGPRGKGMAMASVGLRRLHVMHSCQTLVYVTAVETLLHGVGCYEHATREMPSYDTHPRGLVYTRFHFRST